MAAYRDPYVQNDTQERRSQEYNPYPSEQPHRTYEQGGIGPLYENYGNRYADVYPFQHGISQQTPVDKETEVSPGGLTPAPGGKKTPRALRNYRYDNQGQLWTKGGRGRCIGRFFCCTIMITILLVLSIVLALILWVRPPNVSIGQVNTVAQNGSTIQLQQDGITVNLGVNISVNNPNYFSINVRQIKAEIFYPINNTNVGEGILNDVVIRTNTQTNLTFPFSLNYNIANDPQRTILLDLGQKCGVTGTPSDISVNYRLTLQLQILIIPISPVISDTFTLTCPIDAADLESLMNSVGINISGLSSSA